MSFRFFEITQELERISKAISAVSVLIVFLGVSVIACYWIRVGYSPQNFTIGDGLLFVMAAACFGVIYIIYVSGMFFIAAAFFVPVWRYLLPITCKFIKPKDGSVPVFPPYDWWWLCFAICMLLSFFLPILIKSPESWFGLLMTPFIISMCYIGYFSLGQKIQEAKENLNSKENVLEENAKIRNLRSNRVLIAIIGVFVIPIFFGGVTGLLIDVSMRIANIRIDNAIVYIKEPHSALLPNSLILEDRSKMNEFTAFEKVNILFRGIGSTALISFADGDAINTLEIPNDSLIVNRVERKAP